MALELRHISLDDKMYSHYPPRITVFNWVCFSKSCKWHGKSVNLYNFDTDFDKPYFPLGFWWSFLMF